MAGCYNSLMKSALYKFTAWTDGLKKSKKALLILIGLDVFMAIGSNIADWPWLMNVAQEKWYLIPFAPICSLYPLTLAIWFSLKYLGKKIPAWFTTFIFIAIVSYGIMAYIYYPLYMSWDGIAPRLIGNMVWVTVYALQSFIIVSELKVLPSYQLFLIMFYFSFKDYADRFLGSFIDISRTDFPENFKNLFWVCIIILHLTAGIASVLIPILKLKRSSPQSPAFEKINNLLNK